MDPTADGKDVETQLEALYETGLLDSPREEDFDRLTELTRQLLGVPTALVSLVDEDRQFFKSSQGLPEPWASRRETPLSHSFCQHVVAREEPIAIPDAREHPLVCENLAIRDLNVVAYLGIPLNTPDGYTIGTLCAIDHEPRAWSEEEVGALTQMAALVVKEIELRSQLQRVQRAEQALQLRTEELEQTNRELERFTRIAAHDLQSPLTAILLLVDLLRLKHGEAVGSDGGELLDRIRGASQRMQALIRDLLNYARSGRQTLEVRPVDLSALVDEVRENLAAEVDESNAQLIAESLPCVHGDRTYLSLVFQNLLGNAIKYRGEEAPRIRVSGARDGDAWRIEVADNGVGIAEDELETIFEPFHQIRPKQTGDDGEHQEGYGIGLATCRRVVERHGGQIWAESEPGQGTRFYLTLPETAD